MQIEADIAPLAKKELGKMTVSVRVIGAKKILLRLWIGKALMKLGARVAGMQFRSNHSIEIEVS